MIPENLADAFARQAEACRNLDSPFMGQLCELLATRALPAGPLRDRIYGWPGDVGPSADSVPLRLCGAFHALALSGHGIAAAYPPHCVDDDSLWDAVAGAFRSRDAFIDDWINSPPQTNEVRRAAVLIAIGHWLADRFDLPLKVTELGASGGLNLMWDQFALHLGNRRFGPDKAALTLAPKWDGPLPPATRPQVIARQGVDLNPLNPRDPDDALRLRAYLWPDQPERLDRTAAAIAVNDVRVAQSDAIAWLADHLEQPNGSIHLIYSTIAWQYFPADVQVQGEALLTAAGAKATDQTPLAWFAMEPDGQSPGAGLMLRLWPGDLTIPMGRVDFHGRWVNWKPPT